MAMTSTTRTPSCTTPDLLLICATRDATSQVSLLVVDRQDACAPRWWRRAERGAPALYGFVWRSRPGRPDDGDTWTDESTRQATISCDDERRWRAVVRGRALLYTSTRAGRGSCARRWRAEKGGVRLACEAPGTNCMSTSGHVTWLSIVPLDEYTRPPLVVS